MKKLLSVVFFALALPCGAQQLPVPVGPGVGAIGTFTAGDVIVGNGGTSIQDAANASLINLSSLGFGAGVWGVTPTANGTGYVPGDTITPSSLGTINTILNGVNPTGSYAGAKFYVITTQVVSATVAAGGTSCSGATATLTGTTGTGGVTFYFTATAPITAGAIGNPVTITGAGTYQVNPTSLTNEPVTGSSCSGAQLALVMGVKQVSVQNPGSYSAIPPSPLAGVTQTATSGVGVGFIGTVYFAAQAAYVLPNFNSASPSAASQAQFNYCQGYLCFNSMTSGVENTAFGYGAGSTITTGGFNTLFGLGAGYSLTTAASNVMVGRDAGRNYTTAGNNTYVGDAAGAGVAPSGTTNTGIGSTALFAITTGAGNTAVGNGAGKAVTGANNNSIFGNGSGTKLTTSGANTILGANIGGTNLTGTRNIVVANGANASCDPSGNDNFQICASSGTTHLVTGSLVAASLSWTNNAATIFYPSIPTDAGKTDASVCEDTTTHQLYSGTGTLGVCLGTSSIRYKHDVAELDAGLKQIMDLRPVSYFLNADHGDPNKLLYGFTAEQGGRVLPDLMTADAEGRPNTFDYLGVVPVLVKAVQQQQAEIEDLKRRVR